ncbi:unnamed protein product [Meloidogyne enterolobii]|uniref:Uncharacterized protein n=1 Tax=Meloidogyne enterolobii TaxID=390850 RepID=A0ACB1AG51_MELEN
MFYVKFYFVKISKQKNFNRMFIIVLCIILYFFFNFALSPIIPGSLLINF